MATFNQQNQTVQNQYNAETINFSQIQTSADFSQALKQLQAELEKAIKAEAVTGTNAIDAGKHIKKAQLNAAESIPDKKTLLEHLTSAKALVTNVKGLVTAISAAIVAIGKLF